MTPERWAQIQEVFHRAVESDPQHRTAVLELACGNDTELREQVEQLLASDKSARSKMQAAIRSEFAHVAFSLSGKTVSHYRNLEGVDGGGMGVVYRAEDVKLQRQVAIKFLPEDSAKDPAALRRFEREARAASALEHPNICPIFEFGEHEGQPFLVMQLLEGQTLREIIAAADRNKPPLDHARLLAVGIQVAEGLDAAHRHGIIHRDIKPANIFLTGEGQVKILDFGLAKLQEAETPEEQLLAGDHKHATKWSPNLSLTRTGVAIGTAGYMSPEQLLGEKLDARTDLFSFGTVLYEMATGQKAFQGDTALVLRDAILNNRPRPARELNPELPIKLEIIINRALEKDQKKRYQAAAEIRADLQKLRGDTEPRSSKTGKQILAISTSVLLLAGFTAIYWRMKQQLASPAEFKQRPRLVVTRLTNSGNLAGASISRDGRYLAYVIANGNQQSLRILQIGKAGDVQLLSPADAVYGGVTFSPDSSYIYYTRSQWKAQPALYRIPVLGGVPGKIIEDVDSPAGISPDGKQLAFVRHDATSGTQVVVIANPDGSGEHKLATAKYPEEEFYGAPAWSPDGKVLAIWQRTNLVAVPITGGPGKAIVSKWIHTASQPAWLADGKGLIVAAAPLTQSSSHNQLWEISYPDGRAIPILNDPYRYGQVSLTGDSHALVAEQVDERSSIWVAPAPNPDRARPLTPIAGHFVGGGGGVTWTPDGHILYSSNAKANFEFWMTNPDGTSARQLSLRPGSQFFPSVCPDGRTVVFHAPRDNRWVVERADLEGGGESQVLAEGLFPRCSPEGRWVLFKSENGLQKVSLEGGEPIELTDHPCGMFDISPNGKQIACLYRPGHSPYAKLAIIPFLGGRPTKVLDLPAKIVDWRRISWTPDGQAVAFVVGGPDGMGNISVQPLAGGPPRQLTHFTSDSIQTFDWSRDGRYLAFSRSTETVDAILITNFR